MQSSKHPVENRMFYNKDLETNNADDSGKHWRNGVSENGFIPNNPALQFSSN